MEREWEMGQGEEERRSARRRESTDWLGSTERERARAYLVQGMSALGNDVRFLAGETKGKRQRLKTDGALSLVQVQIVRAHGRRRAGRDEGGVRRGGGGTLGGERVVGVIRIDRIRVIMRLERIVRGHAVARPEGGL